MKDSSWLEPFIVSIISRKNYPINCLARKSISKISYAIQSGPSVPFLSKKVEDKDNRRKFGSLDKDSHLTLILNTWSETKKILLSIRQTKLICKNITSKSLQL